MIKKYQKVFYAEFCFLIFICIGLFYLPINKVFAAGPGLEVEYPAISGQTIGAGTALPDYVKYLFDAGMFIGFFSVFISLIIAGAMYFLSPVSVELRASAKDRVSGAITGLLILALTYLIIITINPQLSILTMSSPPPAPQPPVEKKASGVYFYNKADCSEDAAQPNTSDVTDLGSSKNKVNSVSIVQAPDSQTYYVSVLYDAINFQGKCQYLDPNQNCHAVAPFAASASVYTYDFNPNGDGVYFYRKSYFNAQGGSYKVSNSQINGIYIGTLEDLKFQNVPEKEQDCVKYDDKGNCVGRSPPSLGGENISSVKINGNYFTLFVYKGQNDSASGPWTACQAFPTVSDVNKLGPQQIKWQNIRNGSGGTLPNYVIIIPVQQK